MSSSGINATNSGPLIIRTYNDNSSNKTYLLREYDYPVSSNYVLITSTNGQLAPSNNIYVSSITVSSIIADNAIISTAQISTLFSNNATISTLFSNNATISTAFLSTVFSINSTITFNNEVIINNANQTVNGPPSLLVQGPTVITEPGAISTVTTVLNVYGAKAAPIVQQAFSTTTNYIIPADIKSIRFEMIGAGGSDIFSNSILPNEDLPGYGGYIIGYLGVSTNDSLYFTIGQVGTSTGISSSSGTSLIYINATTGISTLIAIAGAGGGNGFTSQLISSSSGGGHGGGGTGRISASTMNNFVNGVANGTNGYDGLISIGGNLQSVADSGQGGQNTIGGLGGQSGTGISAGNIGGTPTTNPFATTFINGGIVQGGSGGINISTGGTGGGGYSGGGGGAASTIVTAGGGGGASFINYTLLKDINTNGILSNVVSLGGEFLFNNNARPFGQGFGLPNSQGYGFISAYVPNDTIYTNGDIQCRVLRYEQLDPPIDAFGGGSSALWALYPAIDTLNMNDNSIIESGSIQVVSGGIDVTNSVNIRAGENDTLGTNGFMSQFIRTTSSGTYTVDYQVAGDSNGFGSNTWQDARYVYNSTDDISNLSQVWGIVTSSNITPIGSTIGDIHFYKSVYVDGNIGIGTINPTQKLDIIGNINITSTAYLPLISSNIISSGTIYSNLLSSNTISSGIIYSDLLSSNTISSGTIYSGLLSSNTISSGIIYSDLLSSNTISSGIIYSGLLSSNTISSGIIYSDLLSSNTISSGIIYSDLLSSNTISSGIIYSDLLSSNILSMTNGQLNGISSILYNTLTTTSINIGNISESNPIVNIIGSSGVGRIFDTIYNIPDDNSDWSAFPAQQNVNMNYSSIISCNILETNTINATSTINAVSSITTPGNMSCNTLYYTALSPNVVTSLAAGPGISISGGSGGPLYTGALTIEVTGVSLVSAYIIADYITLKINVIKVYSDGSTITTSSSFSLNTSYEIYSSNTLNFSYCQYVIIGGGGGGGGTSGGTGEDVAGGAGGGAAALVYNSLYLLSGFTTININIGSGGTGGVNVNGNNGNNSIILLNPGSISLSSTGGKGGNFGNTSAGGFATGGNDGNNTIQFGGGNGGQGGSNTGFNGALGYGSGGGLYGLGYNPYSANGGGGGGGGLGVLSIFPYSNVFSRGGDGGNASAFSGPPLPPGVNGTSGIYGAGGGGGGAVNSSGGDGGDGFIALYFYN
jgi:hypothetical protein